MTYRIRSLRTGFYFAGRDDIGITSWASGASELGAPIDYPTPVLAAFVVGEYDLDDVEIVEVLS